MAIVNVEAVHFCKLRVKEDAVVVAIAVRSVAAGGVVERVGC